MIRRLGLPVLFLAPLVLLPASCTHAPVVAPATSGMIIEKCISSADALRLVAPIEGLIDTTIEPTERQILRTQPVSETCSKRVYQRAGHLIVVYRDPDASPAISAPGSLEGTRATTVSRAEILSPEQARNCLNQALSDISRMNIPYAGTLLARHRRLHPKLWEDPDIGPVHWLKCSLRPTSDFIASQGTFLHELSHELGEAKCLYFATEDRPLCFELPDTLPKRSLAKLDQIPAREPVAIRGVKSFEEVYLTRIDGGPLSLFDELHSYAITTDQYSAMLETRGHDAVFDRPTVRAYIALPQFMAYAVRYLEKLRRRNPDLFERTFGARTANRNQLRQLFARGEASYLRWLSALSAVQEQPKEPEDNLWRMYLDGKARLDAPAAARKRR